MGRGRDDGERAGHLGILADDDYATLVAVDGADIIGFIGTRIGPLYERDGQYGQIMAFVVTTSHHRADAHAFYEKSGYTFTGRRYSKPLPETGSGSTVRS